MIKLIAAAAFALAIATSAQAMSPAPLHQPDGMIEQVAAGCGVGRTRVAGVCVARTTKRQVRRLAGGLLGGLALAGGLGGAFGLPRELGGLAFGLALRSRGCQRQTFGLAGLVLGVAGARRRAEFLQHGLLGAGRRAAPFV